MSALATTRGPYYQAQGRRESFAELRARGFTITQAADRLGVTRRTADRYIAISKQTPAEALDMPEVSYMPTWDGVGPCIGQPDLMDATDPDTIARARELCCGCPVLTECRDWVLALPQDAGTSGVVAALTPTERTVLTLDGIPRECRSCGETKPLHQFAKWTPDRVHRRFDCRACTSRMEREARAETDTEGST
ncbi:WhiB family transcriptional regulator [Nonomuraea sp. NPDC050394]|uniref:WhiB family transcriptional regulator n=1 Tax=Nonomuraea sp. NPDC050394 TaxID=3364363 RepID=UPI0037B913C2